MNALDTANALDPNSFNELRRLSRENSPAAIGAAAKQFEALFLQMVLKSMRETADLPIEDALKRELEIGEPIIFNTNDAKEGPRAFKEKRKPNFTGT